MKTIEDLSEGTKFKIMGFEGCCIKRKMCNLVNTEGIFEILSKQLFKGPVILKTENYKFAIGRGMARKIYVEEYKP